MFSRDEILAKRGAFNKAAGHEPDLTDALLIASCALHNVKQRNGEAYSNHWLRVAEDTFSQEKKMVGILHDVVEDSEWTLEDLKTYGFSDRVIKGVDAVTKRDGELYFDFIERCGQSGIDAIDVKLKDLAHNSDQSRTPNITYTEKQMAKIRAYNISYYYLVGIKKGEVEPGTPITDFIQTVPAYMQDPFIVKGLMERFSSRGQLQSPYAPGGLYNSDNAPAATS